MCEIKPTGKRVPNEDDVVRALRDNVPYKAIEADYKVCQMTIVRIKRRNGLDVRPYNRKAA